MRWWNVLHPERYAERLRAGRSPAAGRERLSDGQRALERTLLGIRVREGLELEPAQRPAAADLAADGLLDREALARGAALLTLEGRIAADAVALALAPSPAPAPLSPSARRAGTSS